jgi:hypothetical protein
MYSGRYNNYVGRAEAVTFFQVEGHRGWQMATLYQPVMQHKESEKNFVMVSDPTGDFRPGDRFSRWTFAKTLVKDFFADGTVVESDGVRFRIQERRLYEIKT